MFRFRETDPDVERERLGEKFAPVFADRFVGYFPNELIEKKSESAGMIAVRRTRRPERRLARERIDHGGIIEHVHAVVQGCESGLMREKLRQRDRFFAGLGKFRPKLRDRPFQRDSAFL